MTTLILAQLRLTTVVATAVAVTRTTIAAAAIRVCKYYFFNIYQKIIIYWNDIEETIPDPLMLPKIWSDSKIKGN